MTSWTTFVIGFPFTFRTNKERVRVTFTTFALVFKSHHTTHRTPPPSYIDFDKSPFLLNINPNKVKIGFRCVIGSSWKERLDPPDSPSGNRTCGGGFIFLGFDLPGLPIRPPIRVPALRSHRESTQIRNKRKSINSIYRIPNSLFFEIIIKPETCGKNAIVCYSDTPFTHLMRD